MKSLGIGAIRGKMGLCNAARALSMTSATGGHVDNDVGPIHADDNSEVDGTDSVAVMEAAKQLDINRAATSCRDNGVETVGVSNKVLALRGENVKVSFKTFVVKVFPSPEGLRSEVRRESVDESEFDARSLLAKDGAIASFELPHHHMASISVQDEHFCQYPELSMSRRRTRISWRSTIERRIALSVLR